MTAPEEDEFFPLLSGQSLYDYSPEAFKRHVRSLKKERRKKKSRTEKVFKITIRKLKDGRISIRSKRSPLYILESEVTALEEKIPPNELFIALKDITRVKTHAEAQRIRREMNEITEVFNV